VQSSVAANSSLSNQQHPTQWPAQLTTTGYSNVLMMMLA